MDADRTREVRRWIATAGVEAPSAVRFAASVAMLGICYAVSYAVGGAGVVPPQSFYLPILAAASWWSYPGALITAVTAGLLAGPALPLDVATGTPQRVSDWATRAFFFIAIGQVMAFVVTQRRRTQDELGRTRETVAALEERLAMEDGMLMRRRQIHEHIDEILTAGGPDIVVQPIVDLRTGVPVGYEALSRFRATPTRAPDIWFAEAMEVGRDVELELAAIRNALAGLPLRPAETFLSVNLSPATLIDPGFGEILRAAPEGRLVVEITEHAPVDDYSALLEPVAELHARGGRLAVDDVGAGFASLRHILQLDPDIIKLDIGLTRHVDRDPAVRAVATAVIRFAKELDITVISEGIETQQELESLRAMGVTIGQGYHLGVPLPSEEPSEPVSEPPRTHA